MRYLITILLFFLVANSFAQTVQVNQKDSTVFKPSTYAGSIVNVQPGILQADTLRIKPRDTTWHPLRIGTITTPDGSALYLWNGTKWNGISGGSGLYQTATATEGQTAFTFSSLPSDHSKFGVYVVGVLERQSLYSVSGNVVTFTGGLHIGDTVTLQGIQ